MKILIADDEPCDSRLLREAIEAEGHRVGEITGDRFRDSEEERDAPHDPARPLDGLKLYSERLVSKLQTRIHELESAAKDDAIQNAALATTANGILITDADGVIEWVNSAFTRLTGYSAEEAIGNTPRMLKSDELDSAFYSNLWTTIKSGEAFSCVFKNRRKDGQVYFDEQTVTPVKSQDGVITHYVGVMHDVTDRLRAENELRATQSQLRDSIEKFQLIANHITDAFWIRSPDMSEVHYVSPGFETIWGHSVDTLYNAPQTWCDYIFPDDQERVLAEFACLREDQESLDIEYRIIRPNGEVRWIRARGFQVRDSSQKLIRLAGIVTDITDNKKTEEALRESEERFSDAFEHAPIGMALVSPEGQWLRVNRSLCDLFGWTEDELLATTFADSTHPDDLEASQENVRRALAGETRSFQFEKRYVHRNGDIITALLSISLIRDNAGEPLYFISQIQDITERKALEVQMDRLQTESAVILNALGEGVHLIDLEGRIKFENPAAAAMLGYEVYELIGKPAHSTMHHSRADGSGFLQQDCGIYATLTDGKVRRVTDEVFWRKDGSWFDVEYICTPVYDHDQVLRGSVVTFNDVTDRRLAEAEVTRSQGQLRSLIDGLGPSMFVGLMTPDGRMIECNESALDAAGLLPEDVIGKPFENTYWWAYSPEVQKKLRETIERAAMGKASRYDAKIRVGEGQYIDADFTLHPLLDETGQVAFLVPSGNIITERKQAEAELQWKTAFLEAQVHSSIDGVLVVNREGKKILQNQRLVELLHIPKHIDEEIDDEEQVRWVTGMMKDPEKFIEKVIRLYNHPTEVSRDELELVDGTILDRYSSPVLGEDGTNFGRIWTFRDITERKRVEAALRESEERFRDMLENVELIAVILDLDATVMFCNDHLLRVTGWSREEVLGEDWFDRFATECDRDERRTLYESVHTQVIAPHSESPVQTRTGETRDIVWSHTILRDGSGRALGVASIGEDVTERNQATAALERALQETETRVEERTSALAAANIELTVAVERADKANRAKSDFLSRMSHELRTPMNAILGFGQLLDFSDLETLQRESVAQILKGGRHLLQLINDVLELSRIEVGSLGVSLETFPVGEVVVDSIELMRPLANARGIDIVFEEGRSVQIVADRQKLRQVVLNLLSNAIKYNVDNGSVTVRIVEDTTGTLDLEIEDTGIGISEPMQEKLFRPFERLGAENLGIEGTGLGLSLSKSLTEAMGGALTYVTTEGIGSCFSVRLARAVEEASTVQANLLPTVVPSDTRSNKLRLLVVEDNIANTELLKRIFTPRPDITLYLAARGQEALDLAAQHHPDVVLLDLHLPDMSGRDVLAAFRADESMKDVPVIIISADAFMAQTEALLEAGAFRYITKPFDLHELLATVEAALKTRGRRSGPVLGDENAA